MDVSVGLLPAECVIFFSCLRLLVSAQNNPRILMGLLGTGFQRVFQLVHFFGGGRDNVLQALSLQLATLRIVVRVIWRSTEQFLPL